MARAVIYTRVSTADQVENHSLGTQKRDCERYCADNGIEVARVFVDEGASAKTVNRPEFQKMLEYCGMNRRAIDYVVVRELSRFSRNPVDFYVVRQLLSSFAISLRAATQSFDDTSGGELMSGLFALIAGFENRQKAERTIAGMKAAQEKGRWTHQAPIGYLTPRNREHGPSLILDPERAPLIRMAFERISTGCVSKRDVLAEVTRLGLRTKQNRPLSDQSFGAVLRNPIYTGMIRARKFDFEGPGDFQPIVDEALFTAVQDVLDGRRRSNVSRNRQNPDFPLRRFVRCGHCDRPLTASWSRGRSAKFPYYRCPTSGCSTKNIAKSKLEGRFLDELRQLAVGPEASRLFGEIVRDAWRDRNAADRDRIKRASERLQGLQQRKNRVVDAFLHEGTIDGPTYREQSARLEAEIRDARLDERPIESPDAPRVEQAIRFAEGLLADPSRFWDALPSTQKAVFQEAIYPAGIAFVDGKFGTAETSLVFNYFRDFCGGDSEMASPTGIEPVLSA